MNRQLASCHQLTAKPLSAFSPLTGHEQLGPAPAVEQPIERLKADLSVAILLEHSELSQQEVSIFISAGSLSNPHFQFRRRSFEFRDQLQPLFFNKTEAFLAGDIREPAAASAR
jgi:hypothetical protein